MWKGVIVKISPMFTMRRGKVPSATLAGSACYPGGLGSIFANR